MSSVDKVLSKMLTHDEFSKWLGIVIDEYKEGYCSLHYKIRKEMLNGFGIVHGGVLFAAADSAFAFACNSHGRLSVALDVTINFAKAVEVDEVLTVEAKEVYVGNRTGLYDVMVRNESGEIVAVFKGTAYRTNRQVVG